MKVQHWPFPMNPILALGVTNDWTIGHEQLTTSPCHTMPAIDHAIAMTVIHHGGIARRISFPGPIERQGNIIAFRFMQPQSDLSFLRTDQEVVNEKLATAFECYWWLCLYRGSYERNQHCACYSSDVHEMLPVEIGLHVDLISLAAFPRQERVRLGIADNLTLSRIPLELAIQSHRNVRQVANFQHSVMSPNIGNRLFA